MKRAPRKGEIWTTLWGKRVEWLRDINMGDVVTAGAVLVDGKPPYPGDQFPLGLFNAEFDGPGEGTTIEAPLTGEGKRGKVDESEG